MTVRKRGKEGIYECYFMLERNRYSFTLPEEVKKTADARDVESDIKKLLKNGWLDSEIREQLKKGLWTESMFALFIKNGSSGRQHRPDDFVKFTDEVFLAYAKDNKSSWKADEILTRPLKGFFKDKTFKDITPMLVERYIKERLGAKSRRKNEEGEFRNFSSTTIGKEVMTLNSIFRRAVLEGLADNNPVLHLMPSTKKKIKAREHREVILSEEQEEKLIECSRTRSSYLLPMIILGIDTGMRRSELLQAERGHVNLTDLPRNLVYKDNVWTIPPRHIFAIGTKTEKRRVIPLSSRAQDLLAQILGDMSFNKFVFEYEGKPVHPDAFKYGFKRLCVAARIPYGIYEPNGVTFHSLRHTFATRLERVTSPSVVRDLLGHSSLKMTNRYIHSQGDDREKAIASMATLREAKQENRIVNLDDYGKITANG